MLRRFVLSGLGFLGYMLRTVPPPVHVPPRCTVPDFVNYIEEKGYDKFNPRMPVFIGYATFTAWIRDNSLETTDRALQALAKGTLNYPEFPGDCNRYLCCHREFDQCNDSGVTEASVRTQRMIRKLLLSVSPD